MKLLICTSLPIYDPSAGSNRIDRMRRALEYYGIEVIVVGSGHVQQEPWIFKDVENKLFITYDPQRKKIRRHCRAMQIGAEASLFYREYLEEILTIYKCSGVIDYASQAQISKEIMRICRLKNVFVVADVVERHDLSVHYILNGMNYQQSKLCGEVLTQMDGIIGISKAWCEWAEKKGIPNIWIPSFADEKSNVRDTFTENKESFNIVFMGHWNSRELPQVILKAIKICMLQGVNVKLNVLGNIGASYREQRAIRLLEKDKNLKKKVDFVGFVSDKDRDDYLIRSDAFIILRRDTRETDMLFPTRLPEYLLTGNPVIITEVGSFKYCFKHKEDIWFISSKNKPKELADAIIHLARNPEERKSIGLNGRRTALNEFSLKGLGLKLSDYLRAIECRKAMGEICK